MGFGDAFVSAYNATSATLENKRRGDLLEKADKRAQQEWEQKLSDLQEIHALSASVAGKLTANSNELAQLQKDYDAKKAGEPQAQGVQPPSPAPSDAPAAGAAPAGPAAPRTAALTPPPGVGPQTPPPAGPAAGPGLQLNLQGPQGMTPENLSAIAADRAKTLGIPLQEAMSQVTAAMGSNGPGPGPDRRSGTAAPVTDAGAAGPAAPAAAPAGPATGTPKPEDKSGLTARDHINRARKLVQDITPDLVKILLKANPVEGAKLAYNFTNEATQDRMVKTAALGSMLRANSDDPAIPQLMQDVLPGYVQGSYIAHPKRNGVESGYAQYTRKNDDGSTEEIPVFPALIDKMMVSTLSVPGILNQQKIDEETAMRKKELESQEKHRLAAEDMARKQYGMEERKQTEVERHNVSEEGERKERTGYYRELQQGLADDRTQKGVAKAEESAVKTSMTMQGITPQMPADDPQRQKAMESHAWAQGTLEKAGLPLTSANLTRVLPGIIALRNGDTSMVRMKKGETDRYYLDTGSGPPLELPWAPDDVKKRVAAAYAKVEANKPQPAAPAPAAPAQGLQPPNPMQQPNAMMQ